VGEPFRKPFFYGSIRFYPFYIEADMHVPAVWHLYWHSAPGTGCTYQ